ncbi:MAG: hypothetical protein A2V88_17710 [Elusimicrobia bacterium RBG_16_66_12]|nr:MAG: hypothetical protein A2V88_17710 [Elusimicrobia bacterium RBG_16_66_12]
MAITATVTQGYGGAPLTILLHGHTGTGTVAVTYSQRYGITGVTLGTLDVTATGTWQGPTSEVLITPGRGNVWLYFNGPAVGDFGANFGATPIWSPTIYTVAPFHITRWLHQALVNEVPMLNAAIRQFFTNHLSQAQPSWAVLGTAAVGIGLPVEPAGGLAVGVEPDEEPTDPWDSAMADGPPTGQLRQVFRRNVWVLVRCKDGHLGVEMTQVLAGAVQAVLQSGAYWSGSEADLTLQFCSASDCQYGYRRLANETLAVAKIPWSCQVWWASGPLT